MNDELENMLFNSETTYRTDYRIKEYLEPCTHKREPASKTVRTPPAPDVLKDIHTLSDWKRDCVPFDLFINLNDIVRGDPTRVQKVFIKPQDLERERAQKTRPRVIMTPAVAMDDIQSKEARQLLVADMYLSEAQRAGRGGAGPAAAPTPQGQRPILANPISLQRRRPASVCPQWRAQAAGWDRHQRRASVDTHRHFFLRRTQTA